MKSDDQEYSFIELALMARDVRLRCPEIWDETGMFHFDEFAKLAVKPSLVAYTGGEDHRIRVWESKEVMNAFKGVVANDLDNRVSTIIFCKTLNHCRKRFTITKELCQLYIDPVFKHKTVDMERQTTEAVAEIDLNRIMPEQAAIVLAIELSLAWPHRTVLDQMKEEGQSNFDMAKHFRVPEYVVEKYFSKDYRPTSDNISAALDRLPEAPLH